MEDQTVGKLTKDLKDVSSKYEHYNKLWVVTISTLDQKIKMMCGSNNQVLEELIESAIAN